MERAIFLVAGSSSRFQGITEHKALLKICGQTILQRLILQVASLGVRDFVFVTGAAELAIQRECVEVLSFVPHNKVTFVYNNHYAVTGNWVSLQCARGYLDRDVIVLEGDVVFAEFPNAEPRSWVTAYGHDGDGCFVELDEERTIISNKILRDDIMGTDLGVVEKSAGVFFLEKESAEQLASDWGGYEYIDDAMGKLGLVAWDPINSRTSWHEVDNVEDFEQALKKFTRPVSYQPDPVLR